MAIITRNPHTKFVVVNESGKKQTLFNNEHYLHNYPFGFQVPFADLPMPQTWTVTAYNLSRSHRDFYKKGQHGYLYFNWGKSDKLIAEGFISKVDVRQTDGVTDTQIISLTEGTNYNNVKARKLKISKNKKVNHYKTIKQTIPGHMGTKREKYYTTETYKSGAKKGQTYRKGHYRTVDTWIKAKVKKKRVKTRATKKIWVNKTFRKGTTYKQLISGVASQSGIKITKIDLAKNPKLKKNFTAKGKPLTLLKQLVKHTGSKMTYIKGNLEIINPKSSKRTWYHIDDKDLIQPPSYNESSSNDGEGTFEITTPLIPDVTVNVGILMKSKYLTGKFYVTAGEHSSDGDSPQTQMSLIPL